MSADGELPRKVIVDARRMFADGMAQAFGRSFVSCGTDGWILLAPGAATASATWGSGTTRIVQRPPARRAPPWANKPASECRRGRR